MRLHVEVQRTCRIAALLILFASSSSQAADIALTETPSGAPAIGIVGEITKGDFDKIKSLASALVRRPAEVQFRLDSSGGDSLEAIRIGEFVKLLNAKTVIYGADIHDPAEPVTRCYSACFIIFASGSIRDYNGDNLLWDKAGERRLASTPVLGIHRPYADQKAYGQLSPDAARALYQKIENATRSYLSSISIPHEIVDEMFRVSSSNIRLIGKDEFRERIGYRQPYFDEWLISRCGELTAAERNDVAEVLAERIFTNDDSAVPKGLSPGYAGYLVKRHNEIADCTSRTVLSHQRDVLSPRLDSGKPKT